jgi:hypothetical protein
VQAADVIIFDGPAVLHGPDAALLAPHIDGVVLAVDPAVDNREEVAKSRERLLHQNGSRLLGAVTFTPTQQGLGSFLRQLRGQQQLALPPAGATHTAEGYAQAANGSAGAGPIITPEPANAPSVTRGDHEPIITPVSDTLADLTLEVGHARINDVQPTPPAMKGRRARKAARRANEPGGGAGDV